MNYKGEGEKDHTVRVNLSDCYRTTFDRFVFLWLVSFELGLDASMESNPVTGDSKTPPAESKIPPSAGAGTQPSVVALPRRVDLESPSESVVESVVETEAAFMVEAEAVPEAVAVAGFKRDDEAELGARGGGELLLPLPLLPPLAVAMSLPSMTLSLLSSSARGICFSILLSSSMSAARSF